MIELILPIPPSSNMLFPTGRNGRRFKSKRYKEWIEEAGHAMRQQDIPDICLEGRLIAEYYFSFPDKRKRDIANFEKPVTDFLNDYGLFKDDSQIDIMRLIRNEVGDCSVFVMIGEI